jgi:hypothetical protein
MFGFDGTQGTGYGHKGGDPKVHTLQKALNALGLTDDQGKPLADDGKYGPKTTAAVKKLQQKLGLDPTGQVTPQLIEQVARVAKRRPRRQRSAYGSAVVTDDEHAWLHQRAVDILDQYGVDDRVDWDALGAEAREYEDLRLRATEHLRKFNPAEPRNPHSGEWISVGGSVHAVEEFAHRLADAAEGDEADRLTHIDPTDAAVLGALREYQGHSGPTNRALRIAKGGAVDSPVVRGLDKALAGHTLDRDIVVRRAVSNPETTFDGHKLTPGTQWRDHAFVSTTSSEGSPAFAGKGGVEMRILVPKGTKAISAGELDPYEILLDRGLTFRVVRDNGVTLGVRDIDVEVVG